MIPRIIHQTWKDNEVPAEWLQAAESWKTHHPDWEYRLWTDNDNLQLVRKHYPNLLERYTKLPYGILRADIARILILHKHGGVYADLDTECLRPLDSLLDGNSMVIGKEPEEQAAEHEEENLLSNAIFAAAPEHPFLIQLIRSFNSPLKDFYTHRDVLEETGPIFCSRVYNKYDGSDVTVMPADTFSPILAHTSKLKEFYTRGKDFNLLLNECLTKGAYVVHYWTNSWVRSLAGDLHNPEPEEIFGFKFYPHLDSPGHDILNGGRDIPALADLCRNQKKARAFNTDGFIKSKILPKRKWQHMGGPAGKVGLYIKC